MDLTPKLTLLFILILSSFGSVFAQFTKSITLKPIFKAGGRYFYDTKKVHNAYSLEIPLQEINNPEVNRYFKSFKTFQKLRGLSYIPVLAFLLTGNLSSQNDFELYTYLLLGGLAGDMTFNLISRGRMSKAIDIYNISIAQRASLSLQLEKTKANQTLISFGFRQRF